MRWIFLCIVSSLFADKVIVPKIHPIFENPWLTGPLLAPSSVVVPAGHINYEPYFYVISNTGSYNHKGKVEKAETLLANSFQPIFQFGLTSWMDIQIAPIIEYNKMGNSAKWVFGDFPILVDFQLFTPKPMGDWRPYIKFSLGEIFPTGKYRNLEAKKKGTDSAGLGSYQTLFSLVFGKLIHIRDIHFMTARLFLKYTLPSSTHLKGLNAYGEGKGTDAHFFPSQTFQADFGVEYTLSVNWALACDFVGTWGTKSHFSGKSGLNPDGSRAPLGSKASAQYALAPAIEYNWSDNLGLIAGSWFTFAGKNSNRFWGGVLAINYYQ